MLRSMFSAISGLRSHQTMMDVVGNNIANVNTVGYKASRATFQESLTQAERGAAGPVAEDAGGTNPYQIGLGVRVAAIDGNFSQGSVQVTGRSSDVSINGEGFFQVEVDGAVSYMRAGAFSWDAAGQLVTPDGALVLGRVATAGVIPPVADPAPPAAPIALDPELHTDPTIASDGTVSVRNELGELEVIGQIELARFANQGGLQRVGNGLYQVSPNSGNAEIGYPGTNGTGALQAGTVEMSNVDLAAEFTNMIIAQRGLQANSRTITSSDEILQELVNLKR